MPNNVLKNYGNFLCNGPKTKAYLGVSERTTHNYLRYMRKELKAPIKWNTYKKTYTYENTGEFKFEWQEDK